MGKTMTNEQIINQIHGKLIVSCQALEGEPLYSPFIMSRMAYAAALGGACGIRADSIQDITAIKRVVSLPIIGIIKKVFENSPVFITPTVREVDALVACGCEIIATDATKRTRPDGRSLENFFDEIKRKYPDQLFLADCSTIEEGIKAAELGFDLIGTTLSGYTSYTINTALPDYNMMKMLVKNCPKKVIAEGGISNPDELKKAFETGVFAAVVGTAITRPMEITKRFVKEGLITRCRSQKPENFS